MRAITPSASAPGTPSAPAVGTDLQHQIDATSEERAQRALGALEAYKNLLDECGPAEDPETISDLLADLHHLCRRQGESDPGRAMRRLLETATSNFAAEMNPDDIELDILATHQARRQAGG